MTLVWSVALGILIGLTVSWLWRAVGRRCLQLAPGRRLRADKIVADRERLQVRLDEVSEELETYNQALERRANGATSSERRPPSPAATGTSEDVKTG